MDGVGKPTWRQRLLFIPPVAVGIVLLVVALKTRGGPEQAPPTELATPARVIAAPSLTVIPRALAYGNVQPGSVWEAVAQVGGKVVEVHPQLKKGAILPTGEVILRLDPADYRLAATQAEANIAAVEAQLAELEVKERNTRASLDIEERSMSLARKDLSRKRELLKRGNASQAAVDDQERSMLGSEQGVQSLRNTLNLIPAERSSLEAQIALNQARLAEARLDLERTAIAVPFDCRVADVRVETDQYANPGQVLATVDGIAVAEVSAQLPIDKLMAIVGPVETAPLETDRIMGQLRELLGLAPLVRLHAGDITVEWPGRVARISDTIDPQTRTVGVIVAVEDPYRQAQPGIRPPLAKNMFVEVELRGRPLTDQVVVPRSALHDGAVLVVDGSNRLVRRPVELLFVQTNFAVIARGLDAGTSVVISDLIPAIEGMLLAPEPDPAAAAALAAEAQGEGAVR